MEEEKTGSTAKRITKFLSYSVAFSAIGLGTFASYRTFELYSSFKNKIQVKVGQNVGLFDKKLEITSQYDFGLKPISVTKIKVANPIIIARQNIEPEYEITNVSGIQKDENQSLRTVNEILSQRFKNGFLNEDIESEDLDQVSLQKILTEEELGLNDVFEESAELSHAPLRRLERLAATQDKTEYSEVAAIQKEEKSQDDAKMSTEQYSGVSKINSEMAQVKPIVTTSGPIDIKLKARAPPVKTKSIDVKKIISQMKEEEKAITKIQVIELPKSNPTNLNQAKAASAIQDKDQSPTQSNNDYPAIESTKTASNIQSVEMPTLDIQATQPYYDNDSNAYVAKPAQQAQPAEKTETKSAEPAAIAGAIITSGTSTSTVGVAKKVYTFKDFVLIQDPPASNPSPNMLAKNEINPAKTSAEINRNFEDALEKVKKNFGIAESVSQVQAPDKVAAPKFSKGFFGKILEGFAGGSRIVEGAQIQVLGTTIITKSDAEGIFSFENIKIMGVLPVLVTKEGYLNRRIDLMEAESIEFELLSENAAALSAVAAGDSRNPAYAFLFGQLISTSGEDISGKRVEISGQVNPRIIYFSEKGIPTADLKSTSSRGQFIVLNMNPGTYLVNILDEQGREKAPHVLHVSSGEGIVRKFNMGEQRTIQGTVFNALTERTPVDKAQVQILGSAAKAVANARGKYNLGPLYIDCSEKNYVQVDKPGFYRNRLAIQCSDNGNDLYVFPASHVDGVSVESQTPLNPNSGIILGKVSFNESVKVQLWGPDEVSPNASALRGVDFYFDNDKVLNATRNRTSSNGQFVILTAPEGLSYIQTFNRDNETLSYWPILLSPSTVNVYVQ